jgi:hypothetical protein
VNQMKRLLGLRAAVCLRFRAVARAIGPRRRRDCQINYWPVARIQGAETQTGDVKTRLHLFPGCVEDSHLRNLHQTFVVYGITPLQSEYRGQEALSRKALPAGCSSRSIPWVTQSTPGVRAGLSLTSREPTAD